MAVVAGPPAASQPASAQGKNLLTQKWGPLPVWGWLGIITVAFGAYYLLAGKKKSASSGGSGGGLPQTPSIIIQNQEPGAPPSVTPPGPPLPGPQPTPNPSGPSVKGITVTRDQTFGQMAADYHWSKDTIAAIEGMNQIAGGGHLTPSTPLKKGQVILRPIGQ